MKRPGGKVAILGGGMAGLSAAWRLSEPGWRDRFDSITVYERGHRLGGKAASSRGVHGRIEEHGLHIWLGCYENAFALLRECYAELNRADTDPQAPIRSWTEAMIPADDLGLAEQWGTDWLTWLGTFRRNEMLPGDPKTQGREMNVVAFVERAIQLVFDFADSQRNSQFTGVSLSTSSAPPPPPSSPAVGATQRALLAAMAALVESKVPQAKPIELLDGALDAVREAIDYDTNPAHRRSFLLLSFVTAAVRGIFADDIVTNPRGMRAINDEDFGRWIVRHGGHPEVPEFPLVRGLYDLVFGYQEADPDRPAFGAGLMLFLIGLVLFEYKGAIFWKMTAGMGDVVIAPIYEVLRRRGVEFEFFHRIDALHVDAADRHVESVTVTRQATLRQAPYEPLTRVRGLPVFPDAPIAAQLSDAAAETRLLRRGVDFDHVVLAVSLGMIGEIATELVARRHEWRDMTTRVHTVATQAFQIWLRDDEPTLGWPQPGVTISAYERPFETWASMPQTLWAEDWPDDDRPGTVAYFCGALHTSTTRGETAADHAHRMYEQVCRDADAYIDRHLGLYFPKAFTEAGFDRRQLVSAYVSANVDPSERYVQSVPGSDRYRLCPDESGYDNLVLAGDWTDSGVNAGCIESAVMSGLVAANALLGRGRFHRIRGFYLP